MPAPLNFIMLVGEDTGRHHGCYGDSFARTPYLDRLAAEGCRFINAYCTAPVCAPSRSSMVTGQFPTKIGTHLMRSRLNDPPRLFLHELRDAGYFVDWANKTDFNFHDPQDMADRKSDWRDDLAAGRLNDRPFFLYMNFELTHESRMWPPGAEPRVPADEPDVDDASLDDLPGLAVPPYLPDTRTTRASLVRYYRQLEEHHDAEVGRVLEALEQSGQADNTVVLYLTDHGRGLVREKRWCYEAGVHLPLIVRGPGGLTQPGTVRDDLVSWVDLAPTFHALADLPIPERYDGRVFLGPQTQPEPDAVFFGRDRMDSSHDKVRGAADRRYLYVRNDRPDIPYAQCTAYMETSPVTTEVRQLQRDGKTRFPVDLWMATSKPAEELYDKTADPHCVHNLADRSDHADVLQRLRTAVGDWCSRVGDKGLIPEQTLVDDGVIEDQIAEYDTRYRTLPASLDPEGRYNTHRDASRV